MFNGLIFDLDGTLWDPADGIAKAWNRVCERHAIAFRPITADDIRSVTGLPHDACIAQVFSSLPKEQRALLNRETQKEDKQIFVALPLPLIQGVKEGIEKLAGRYPLFIVSNCQKGYIEGFLKASQLHQHFTDWESWGDTGLPKSKNLHNLIDRNSLDRAAFIGDTPGDEVAANACQVPYFHVKYGYSEAQAPVKLFASFGELTAFFLESAVN